MSMSKKDFIELADHIRFSMGDEGIEWTEEQLNVLASFCGTQNCRFLRQRWLAYIKGKCGPSGGEIKPKRVA